MAEAGGLEDVYQRHKDSGFMLLETIIENNEYEAPSEDELLEWADEYGMTMPVLADPNGATMWSFGADGGLPFMVLFDRGMVIENTGYLSESDIEALLAE
ncbi:MAG: peroxiredoxin family protein [Myxococcota bacterium]